MFTTNHVIFPLFIIEQDLWVLFITEPAQPHDFLKKKKELTEKQSYHLYLFQLIIQCVIRKHFSIVPKDPDHILVEMNESYVIKGKRKGPHESIRCLNRIFGSKHSIYFTMQRDIFTVYYLYLPGLFYISFHLTIGEYHFVVNKEQRFNVLLAQIIVFHSKI